MDEEVGQAVTKILTSSSKCTGDLETTLKISDSLRILTPEHPHEEKKRCSGSYCQAVGFLVIKDDSISERPG